MNNIKRITFVFAVSLSLLNCGGGQHLVGDDSIPEVIESISKDDYNFKNSNKSVVIFSTTFEGSDALKGGFLYLHSMDDKFNRTVEMWGREDDARLRINEGRTSNKIIGKVHVLELKPGEYEFYHYYTRIGDYELSSSSRFYLKFKVEAGEKSYLGNINIKFGDGGTAGRYRISLNNLKKRDIEVVNKSFVNSKEMSVQTQRVHFLAR